MVRPVTRPGSYLIWVFVVTSSFGVFLYSRLFSPFFVIVKTVKNNSFWIDLSDWEVYVVDVVVSDRFLGTV